MIASFALHFWQLLCLIVTAAGWGGWVWLITGRPAPFRHLAWLWCGLAGFCGHTLVLQGLVYLDLPLGRTAWPALGVTVAGLVIGLGSALKNKGNATPTGWIELRYLLGVFAAVLVVESAGVLVVGPRDYYGKGRYDQANYVVLAQFLADQPFSSGPADVGLHPWTARSLETKEQRITQSVAHAALAVVSGGDCQQAYGAMTVFLVGLIALAVTAWLREFSAPRILAALGGLGAALCPAVTNLQLDGYFSQASTLFILPALAALLLPRGPLEVLPRLAAALLLAFWIGAYTEVAVVGVGLVVILRLTAEAPWSVRLRELAWIGAGALLANAGYALRLPAFLFGQLAQARDPHHLEALASGSGTWLGWGRLFLDLPPGPVADRLAIVAGGAVLALGLGAIFLLPRLQRWRLWLTLILPVGLLAWLALQPVLAKYPFAKLLAGFAPLWVGTAVLGLVAFSRMRLGVRVLLAGALLGAGALSTVLLCLPLVRREGILAELSSPAMHRLRDEAHQHPERTYLVVTDHPLVTQWVCYFAREAQVYLDRRHLGDRVVPSETYAFRRLPAATTELWWLDPQRQGPVFDFQPACRLHVSGAVETGTITSGQFYVMPRSLQFSVARPSTRPAFETLWLDFVGLPLTGPNPLELELSGPGLPRQRVTLTGPRMLRFHLALVPGKNEFTLRALAPAGESPRTLIVQSLSLDPITAVQLASDPAPAEFVR